MRIQEAQALESAGHHAGALYLGGYAVECALKACIARQVQRHDWPDPDWRQWYTHTLNDLLRTAGLKQQLESDKKLRVRWNAITQHWSEQVRYDPGLPVKIATDVLRAIDDPNDGILVWLQGHW